jgi:hypothetical protein
LCLNVSTLIRYPHLSDAAVLSSAPVDFYGKYVLANMDAEKTSEDFVNSVVTTFCEEGEEVFGENIAGAKCWRRRKDMIQKDKNDAIGKNKIRKDDENFLGMGKKSSDKSICKSHPNCGDCLFETINDLINVDLAVSGKFDYCKIFNTCTPQPKVKAITNSSGIIINVDDPETNLNLQEFILKLQSYARGAIASVAMLNYPYPQNLVAPLAAHPVKDACKIVADGLKEPKEDKILEEDNATKEDNEDDATHDVTQFAFNDLNRLESLNSVIDLYVSSSVSCKDVEKELIAVKDDGVNSTKDGSVAIKPIADNAVSQQLSLKKSAPEEVKKLANTASQQTSQEVYTLSTNPTNHSESVKSMDMGPWNYQACTQLPMEPLSSDYLGFFPPLPGQEDLVERACRRR